MDFPGSGFLTILQYSANNGTLPSNDAILAENNDALLTESGNFLLIES